MNEINNNNKTINSSLFTRKSTILQKDLEFIKNRKQTLQKNIEAYESISKKFKYSTISNTPISLKHSSIHDNLTERKTMSRTGSAFKTVNHEDYKKEKDGINESMTKPSTRTSNNNR